MYAMRFHELCHTQTFRVHDFRKAGPSCMESLHAENRQIVFCGGQDNRCRHVPGQKARTSR